MGNKNNNAKNTPVKGSAGKSEKGKDSHHSAEKGGNHKVKISEILVGSFKEAEMIEKELDKGVKFEDLAKKYSIDKSKASGGEIGSVEKSQVPEEIFDAAITLRINEYSDPIQIKRGYAIVKKVI
jgi:parvulin-like peptidyl-prolyl isomerase